MTLTTPLSREDALSNVALLIAILGVVLLEAIESRRALLVGACRLATRAALGVSFFLLRMHGRFAAVAYWFARRSDRLDPASSGHRSER